MRVYAVNSIHQKVKLRRRVLRLGDACVYAAAVGRRRSGGASELDPSSRTRARGKESLIGWSPR
jgi:hypothetical protein